MFLGSGVFGWSMVDVHGHLAIYYASVFGLQPFSPYFDTLHRTKLTSVGKFVGFPKFWSAFCNPNLKIRNSRNLHGVCVAYKSGVSNHPSLDFPKAIHSVGGIR